MRFRIFVASFIVVAALVATGVHARTAKANVMVTGLWAITMQEHGAPANETACTTRCAKSNATPTSRFSYSDGHFDGTVVINTPWTPANIRSGRATSWSPATAPAWP